MSYNIDTVDYIGDGRLTIRRGDALRLKKKAEDAVECSFIEELDLGEDEDNADLDVMLTIEKPWWYGEGSGRSFELFKQMLSKTKGHAQLLLVWEGGDSQSGLDIKDGKVTARKVMVALGDEEGDEEEGEDDEDED